MDPSSLLRFLINSLFNRKTGFINLDGNVKRVPNASEAGHVPETDSEHVP